MVKIGNREIDINNEPYIVAEVGINHNGDLNKAFEMIKVAKKSGVDAVKFQTFKAEEFVNDSTQMFSYKSQGQEITEPMLDMFKRYEFTKEEWQSIKSKCDELGITFLSTPQNESDLELLMQIGIDAIKVGSDDFTNLPLLKSYAKIGLPLIISCGMADMAEVYETLNTLDAFNGESVILLLCTSQYPTPVEDVNLNKLKTLASSFPNITLGFSDHTQGFLASSLAITYGARFFEKHFTLDNDLPGPDHWFSENPASLEEWVNAIRMSYKMLGDSIIRPTKAEEQMKIIARRHIVALNDINEGEELNSSNLVLRRTGEPGLVPKFYEEIQGSKALKNISKGEMIRLGDFYVGK
ncbi:N-acetylneuraminate synthase family protein [Solibacillus sp. FSL H8-0523]|uniref:N-acetylneuraminate synthase family protein n=1 Tax=Solibacillus sp. FSL H8-0523 TaxID=2954511 RepID=UPI003100CC90